MDLAIHGVTLMVVVELMIAANGFTATWLLMIILIIFLLVVVNMELYLAVTHVVLLLLV